MATLTDPTGRGRKARTITATDPATGARITRRTARTYVAVVVTGDPAQGQAWAQSWCGRPDLAAKALAKWGPDSGARLAPVTSDPWAAPEATPAPAAPAPPAPEGGRVVATLQPGPSDGPYLAGDGVTLWSFPTEALARQAAVAIAAAGVEPYLAGPGPLGHPVELPLAAAQAAPALEAQAALAPPRPTLPGEATPPPAPAALGDAAPALPPLPVAAPADRVVWATAAAADRVAAHRAAAAAGRPVSLAALARDLGHSLGLASGGRLPRYGATGDLPARPAPAAAPAGDPLEGQPWDPGTPEARARVADQGRIVARLHPIARAATGAGCTLPPSWASDGPALNGELPPMRALEALPLPTLAAAAAALAALPPVTEAQAQGLAYCRAALRARAARL